MNVEKWSRICGWTFMNIHTLFFLLHFIQFPGTIKHNNKINIAKGETIGSKLATEQRRNKGVGSWLNPELKSFVWRHTNVMRLLQFHTSSAAGEKCGLVISGDYIIITLSLKAETHVHVTAYEGSQMSFIFKWRTRLPVTH